MRDLGLKDVLIAGAGPAGVAAAIAACGNGVSVTLLDDNPAVGGQIWRGKPHFGGDSQAATWLRRLKNSGAVIIPNARIISGNTDRGSLTFETATGAFDIQYRKLVLATGARELFLPFPGWTLPNVMGVGGLQALVKSGLPVDGKRIVIAGTGPLLLAAGSYFRSKGAIVAVIAEQTGLRRLARFGWQLLLCPGKFAQAVTLRIALWRSRYLPSCWVEAAEGSDRVIAVRLRRFERTWLEPCDYLAIGYGFRPNTELPDFLGCALHAAGVQVDEFQRTSIETIYCGGECTGIGGVDLSLLEGEIAGHAASGRQDRAAALFRRRAKAQRFAAAIARAFALRNELRSLSSDHTIICRCEDVRWHQLRTTDSCRSAKLYSRCGMGPCQGRVCGPILEFLRNVDFLSNVEFLRNPNHGSIRAPVFPARIETLISGHEMEEGKQK